MPTYQPPQPGQSGGTAALTVYSGKLASTRIDVVSPTAGDCRKQENVRFIGQLENGPPGTQPELRTIRIPAGQPFRIAMGISGDAQSGISGYASIKNIAWCFSGREFDPVAGEHYVARYEFGADRCAVAVRRLLGDFDGDHTLTPLPAARSRGLGACELRPDAWARPAEQFVGAR